MSWEIRQFDEGRDLEMVLDLWRQAGPGVQLSPSDAPDELEKKLARDPELFLVAVDGTEGVIGTVLGGYDGRRGMVYHLAVRHQWRRQGVGRRLMEEVERRLRGLGCLKCYLLMTRENDAGRHFYEELGWDRMELSVWGKFL